MRLISGTSDIFGKLPGGLPGARQAYANQDLFGLGAAGKHKRKKGVHAVEDGAQTPGLLPDYGPTGQKYRELPAPAAAPTHKLPGTIAYDQDYGSDLFGLGKAGNGTIAWDQDYGSSFFGLGDGDGLPLSPNKSYGSGLFGFGQDQPATAQATPPATQPAQPGTAHPEGGHHGPPWLMIGLGVAVVGGIIAYLIYNSKKPAGAMGGVSSKRARKFIRRQTKKLIKAGLPQKRAVAAAYSMARQKHYKVPAKG